MNRSISLAVLTAALTVAGGLSGCASTSESPQGTTQIAPSTRGSPGEPGAAASGIDTGGQIAGNPESGHGAANRETRPDLKRSVYYEFDKFDVRPEYRALVESHARWLRGSPQARLTIEGNADERGSREYNLSLGQRRAESVTRLMQMHGVRPEQIEAVSFGKEKPRATGHDEAAWAENRRADLADR